MPTVMIIGSGQLGSRHLQALKKVNLPLSIIVVDPSPESLAVARQRYDSIPENGDRHAVSFHTALPEDKINLDIVIVATNSSVRRPAIESVLQRHPARYFVVEKLLFQKKEDYAAVSDLFRRSGVRAWVNCPMRQMSFYHDLKSSCVSQNVFYTVTGSDYGLVTNAIHFIDHMAYLSECPDFSVDTESLIPIPVPSKRKGFLELHGTLAVQFTTGSRGVFISYPHGDLPVVVDISSDNFRFISREYEGKSWISNSEGKWVWKEIETKIPYQSQLTTDFVEQLLASGTCPLVSYDESAKIHVTYLDALLSFLNHAAEDKFDLYPFT